MSVQTVRGVVRDGKVEVNLPDGTEVLILPESAETPLSSAEIAQVVATMPPFEWTAEDEAEWQAEKAAKAK
ncbi:MAG: hypothetical protein U0791_24900 [Gemmataceae bacterium]